MTEQTGFGGLAVAEPQTAVLSVDEFDDGSADNRRKLALVGAAVGVVVLLLATFFLLKGGGDSTTAPLPPHIVPPAADQASTGSSKAAADKPVKLPKSYKGPVGRDPFKALYVAPVEQRGDAGQSPTDSATTGATSNPPKDSGLVTVTAVPGTTTVPSPVWVELVRVNGTSSATFVVAYNDGSSLKTQRFDRVVVSSDRSNPTVFGGVFALLSVHDGKATVQYGDGTPIEVTPGANHRLVVG